MQFGGSHAVAAFRATFNASVVRYIHCWVTLLFVDDGIDPSLKILQL